MSQCCGHVRCLRKQQVVITVELQHDILLYQSTECCVFTDSSAQSLGKISDEQVLIVFDSRQRLVSNYCVFLICCTGKRSACSQ